MKKHNGYIIDENHPEYRVIFNSFPPSKKTGMSTGNISVGIRATEINTKKTVAINTYRHQHLNKQEAIRQLKIELGI